jgi:hypothetical protein
MRAFYIVVAVVGIAAGGVAAYLAGLTQSRSAPALDGEFTSGPQVGAKLPGPFEPLHINGPDRGDEACVYCKYGSSHVVMIFASKPSDALASLVLKIEKAAAEGAKHGEIGACAILTDTSAATKTALGKLADKDDLKQVVLGVIEPDKLKKYALNPDAEVTVLLYSNLVVRVNRAFKAGELTEKAIAELADEAAKFYAAK